MPDRLDQVLEDCLELLRQGVSLEECLSRHPEEAEELEPLLQIGQDARHQAAQRMPLEARSRVRARVLAEWDRRSLWRRLRHSRGWAWSCLMPGVTGWTAMPRWAAVAAGVIMAIFLGGASAVTAAGTAIPGDLLYPVKEMRESTSLWFARSPEAKVAIYTQLVKERVNELQELTATGQTDNSSVALARLEGHVSQVARLVEENVQQSGREPPATDAGYAALQGVMAEQIAAEITLQQALEQAPAEAQPGLRQALEALQRGRDRVRSALDSVRPPAPVAPSPSPEGE